MDNLNHHELLLEIAKTPEELRASYVAGLLARLRAEARARKKLVALNAPDLADELTATEAIRSSDLKSIDRIMGDLLTAACGMQQFEHSESEMGFLMAALGQHIRQLRNDLARNLEPVFEAFGVQPVGY